MKNIRFYIKSTNFYECDKAKKILKQLGYVDGNFISARSEGWVYGDSDGVIKFLRSTITSYPAAHADLMEYRVYNVDNFPQEIIKAYKLNNIKKLITQPIVTKKEYRKTIEVAKEIRDHIMNYENNDGLLKCYDIVIKDLEKRYRL